MVQFRNALSLGDGRFDCEINHPVYGWIPFTADPDDVEELGRAVAAAIAASGQVPEKPPTPVQIPQQMTFAQLLIGLVSEEWITEGEGEAWLVGTVPAPVSALIGSLPEGQRFAARARAVRPSIVLRNDPLVVALAALQEKTPEQLDAFFVAYSEA